MIMTITAIMTTTGGSKLSAMTGTIVGTTIEITIGITASPEIVAITMTAIMIATIDRPTGYSIWHVSDVV